MTTLKQLSKMRRLLPPSLLALASLAYAGHWETTYSGGQYSGGYVPYPISYGTSNGSHGGAVSGSGNKAVKCSGTITATLTWHPDSTGDAPPAYVYVEESSSASAYAYGNSVSASADNGIGTKPVNTSYNDPSGGRSDAASNSIGIRVRQMASTGTIQITCEPKADAGAIGQCTVSVSYSARVVDYAVSIFSDRDESFHKGATGQESNSTDVLTPRFGDTWIDPASFTRQGTDDDPNYSDYFWLSPTFTADLLGGWASPLHVWNLDGTTFSDDFFHEYASVSKTWVYSADVFAALSDSPDAKVITLQVTDQGGSGVSANATYTMRIHHPYEKWHKIADLPDVWQYTDPTYPQDHSTISGGNVHVQWNAPNPMWKLASVATQIASADISGSLWKYFFKAAGIGLTDLAPKPHDDWVGFDACWGKSRSWIEGGDWSQPKSAYRLFEPQVATKFNVHKWEADGYGPNGYVGPVHEGATDPAGESEYVGNYYLQTSGVGGGTP